MKSNSIQAWSDECWCIKLNRRIVYMVYARIQFQVSETCLTISQRKPSDTAENHTTLIDKRKRDLSGLLVADYIGLATSKARATHVMLTLSWKKKKNRIKDPARHYLILI